MSSIRFSLLYLLFAILPAANGGQPSLTQPAWIDDLHHGGYVIVLRHGATVSDQSNTDSMSRKNVPAERQLNAEGRAQAKSTGEAMRKLRIPVGMVVTSTIQRAVDTATLLGFGAVAATPDLAEGASPDESNQRALALRKLAATTPPAGTNVVIVSHKPNIVAAFGSDWSDVREGEASVFEPDRLGGYKLIGRIQASDWTRWAQAAD
ncbi:histidine phosphatase family protein [Bradyrhizobium sp. HKCCYLS1011]|uniref:histidine phosphatase family protein n=1 Tax=Bradyrhizobium sp. HKCCYLS1011 TaxID=3420733 RepID=UPI003EB7DFCE